MSYVPKESTNVLYRIHIPDNGIRGLRNYPLGILEPFCPTDYTLQGNNLPEIHNVIFNDPATIVYWKDGTKTVVKCQPGDTYSKETGLAMAMLKRFMGNDNTYNKVINKWLRGGESNESHV